MSLTKNFDQAAALAVEGRLSTQDAANAQKRPSPFSIRLSEAERARLAMEAAGAPIGEFIKSRLFGDSVKRKRRKGQAIEDREALAQALALLGRSHLSSNLNQVAHAVNIGVLPVTPETEAELLSAVREVRQMRKLLFEALGYRTEDQP